LSIKNRDCHFARASNDFKLQAIYGAARNHQTLMLIEFSRVQSLEVSRCAVSHKLFEDATGSLEMTNSDVDVDGDTDLGAYLSIEN